MGQGGKGTYRDFSSGLFPQWPQWLARVEPRESQEPGTPSRSLTLMQGPRTCTIISACTGRLAESCIESEAARVITGGCSTHTVTRATHGILPYSYNCSKQELQIRTQVCLCSAFSKNQAEKDTEW